MTILTDGWYSDANGHIYHNMERRQRAAANRKARPAQGSAPRPRPASSCHPPTTQNPWEVWLAVTPASRKPRIDHPPVHVARFSGPAFREGVEHHPIDGVNVSIYSPAKTVADCFKYRNKIGIDIAIEALRDAWGKRAASADQLWQFAKVCRVANVMRPYLDTIAQT